MCRIYGMEKRLIESSIYLQDNWRFKILIKFLYTYVVLQFHVYAQLHVKNNEKIWE